MTHLKSMLAAVHSGKLPLLPIMYRVSGASGVV